MVKLMPLVILALLWVYALWLSTVMPEEPFFGQWWFKLIIMLMMAVVTALVVYLEYVRPKVKKRWME